MTKVSIVIPFYNCPYIDQAIESALAQTYPNLEVIVVNDGSSRFTEKITPYLSKVRYFEKRNGGTASALNVGIQHATGEYFAWLSSDDWFPPEKIARQLAFMQERSSYFSHTNYSLMDANSHVFLKAAGLHFPYKVDFLKHLQTGCSINGCTVMMKMELFSSLGYFNESLRCTQDYDFWLRAVQHYEFDYLNECLLHYRVHDAMGTKTLSKVAEAEIKQLNKQYATAIQALIDKEQSRKIRFTFPILTLCKGGAQRVLADMCNGLAQRGHDVTIIMPPQGVIEYEVQAKLVRTRSATLTAADYPNGDLIVSNFYSIIPSAKQASENGKGIHIRFSLCYEPMFLPNQDVSFQTYNETPHLFVISQYQRDLISLIHGIEGSIIPIYVEPSFTNLQQRIHNKTLNITAIIRKPEGGHSWQRDQGYLLDQLYMVKQKYPHLKFNLICPPNELEASPALKQVRASGLFHFYTPVNDEELLIYYNEADIFVTSSVFETAVLPGLEAMRCGAALAAVYAGGNTEYCRHEQNCLLSYRYENRLASDIIRLIEDEALRTRLAKQGQIDSETWSLERSVSAFEAACRDILVKSTSNT